MNLNALIRKNLPIAGAAFVLSAGLVACNSNTDTPPTISDGLYPVTVEFSGIGGKQDFVIVAPDGTKGTYTLSSGSIVRLAPGTYTITGPTSSGNTPSQTVTVTNAAQTVTFAY